MKKNLLIIGIIFIFIFSTVTPITFGNNVKTSEDQIIVEDYNFDSYHISEITSYAPHTPYEYNNNTNLIKSSQVKIIKETFNSLGSPIDAPWPMFCHDVRHTGRSPYNTSSNNGLIKWKLRLQGLIWGSPIIDDNGIIYVGAWDFYAIYPNGTIKWQLDISAFSSAAAIDDNGIIYIGSIWAMPNYLYAIYSSNGTIKWKFFTGDAIYSSPAIGDDGTIYFGCDLHKIYALYPNGTLKWEYNTGDYVLSSPAIGEDGTIYCGSHDTYLYALYPNNGTLKWKYKTGHWIRTSPCIADDGTIYVVSLDNHLHAVNPDGTQKWKTNMGEGGTSPTIGQDGTIYCGYSKLHAVNPTDGSVKWSFDVQGKIRGGTPCNSIDGTIYLGNYDGSDIVAVNPDGTEKWRVSIGGDVESAPAISEDGTVYIGDGTDDSHFYAFGYPGPNPLTPTISGPISGKPGIPYTYSFTSVDPDGDQVSYYIDWDDGNITDWTDFQPSGELYTESHTWTTQGTYTIRAKAKDLDGYESDWGILTVTMPRDKAINRPILNFLQSHPNLFLLLQKLIQRFEL